MNSFKRRMKELLLNQYNYYNLTFIVVVLTNYIFHSGFICIPFEML